MIEEQGEVGSKDREDAIEGRNVPHLLRSCRRAGLLERDILEALALEEHPLVRGALRAPQLVA